MIMIGELAATSERFKEKKESTAWTNKLSSRTISVEEQMKKI